MEKKKKLASNYFLLKIKIYSEKKKSKNEPIRSLTQTLLYLISLANLASVISFIKKMINMKSQTKFKIIEIDSPSRKDISFC